MNKNTLKSWLRKEDIAPKEEKFIIKLWDLLMMWAGYEGYYSIREIAYYNKITEKTVYNRIQQFKRKFPEPFEQMKKDRELKKRVHFRLSNNLRHPLSYDPKMDAYIVEKY